jgi:hypothetical protein
VDIDITECGAILGEPEHPAAQLAALEIDQCSGPARACSALHAVAVRQPWRELRQGMWVANARFHEHLTGAQCGYVALRTELDCWSTRRPAGGTCSALKKGMLPALALCLSACASIGFISHCLGQAPEGWEDERGFHHGKVRAQVRRNTRRVRGFNPHFFPLKSRPSGVESAAYH